MNTAAFFRPSIVLVLGWAALTGGCVARYDVKIDTMARANLEAGNVTSYQIRNKRGGPDADTLRFKEAAKHIKTALSAHGLYEAPEAVRPDMIVEVDYTLGAPHKIFIEVQEPVFGNTGSDGGPREKAAINTNKEFLGYQDTKIPLVVRDKQMSICGVENVERGPTSPPRELWRVEVSIEDESSDLRRYLPLLASAAMDRIGSNSDGTTTTKLRQDDEAVAFIKKGM